MHPHEEPAGVAVAELLAVPDVGALAGQARRDRGDDPRPVPAGQGQDRVHPGLPRPAPLPPGPGLVRRMLPTRPATPATTRLPEASRCSVVLQLMSVVGSLACGVLRPHPRWSNSTTRYRPGSNPRRMLVEHPAPGPPCTTEAGLPSGLPQVSSTRGCHRRRRASRGHWARSAGSARPCPVPSSAGTTAIATKCPARTGATPTTPRVASCPPLPYGSRWLSSSQDRPLGMTGRARFAGRQLWRSGGRPGGSPAVIRRRSGQQAEPADDPTEDQGQQTQRHSRRSSGTGQRLGCASLSAGRGLDTCWTLP
jgi:hypothetical protein